MVAVPYCPKWKQLFWLEYIANTYLKSVALIGIEQKFGHKLLQALLAVK